jgi:hypothetical protein
MTIEASDSLLPGGRFARRDRAGNRSWRFPKDISSAEVIGFFSKSPLWPIDSFTPQAK